MSTAIKNKFRKIFKRRQAISPMVTSDLEHLSVGYSASDYEYKTPRSSRFCDKAIHDPEFECCFCYHESKYSSDGIFDEIDLYDTKPDDINLPSHRYFDRDCSILESSRRKMTEDTKYNLFFNNNPKLIRFYKDLPNHDRRIIDCMMAKRSKDLLQMEDSFIAHKHWANESTLNKKLITKYNKIYNSMINRKNTYDHEQLIKRLNYLASLTSERQNKLRTNLAKRDIELNKRLTKLKQIKKYCQEEKNYEAKTRANLINLNNYENTLDTEIKIINCLNRLDDKMHNAERIRNSKLNGLKSKIKIENDIIKHLNEFNKTEIKNYDKLKKFQLMEYINERDRKYRKFLDEKQKYFSDLNEKARKTAEFRNLIRSSITPENMCFKVKHYRNITDRSNSSVKTNFTTPF